MDVKMPATSPLFWREDTLLGSAKRSRGLPLQPPVAPRGARPRLLWNPLVMIYTYLGLAAVVLISRLLAPNPRLAARPEAETAQEAPAANELDQYPLPIAA